MSISDSLLPEFDQEIRTTRKFLERVPEDRFAWKPHEKSMSMGNLSTHLTELPQWCVMTLKESSLDIAPPGGGEAYQRIIPKTREELLEKFDNNAKAAREAIVEAADAKWIEGWTLLKGGRKIFTLPRVAVVRNMVLNHLVHHRAQLGVYFRLNDIPVPPSYGPTADEGTMG